VKRCHAPGGDQRPRLFSTTSQRQAKTKDAGKIAGLEVLRNHNEPTAAAWPMASIAEARAHPGLSTSAAAPSNRSRCWRVGDGVFECSPASGGHPSGAAMTFDKVMSITWLPPLPRAKRRASTLRQDKQALRVSPRQPKKARSNSPSATQSEINLPFNHGHAGRPPASDLHPDAGQVSRNWPPADRFAAACAVEPGPQGRQVSTSRALE